MRLKLLLSAFLLFIIVHFAAAQKPVNTYSVQGWWGLPAPPFSPVVHTNGTIKFRVKAPNALKVNLLFGEWDSKPQPLSRDSVDNWSITIGPVAPDIYSCLFSIDEINTSQKDWNGKPARPPKKSLKMHKSKLGLCICTAIFIQI